MNEVLRQERKFLLSVQQKMRFEAQLDALLHPDQHNGPTGSYLVRSLYFDTLGERDFLEKMDGVENRRKIRLRIYAADSPAAFLEMKQKQGSNQLKRSLRMDMGEAKRLVEGDYGLLLSMKDSFAAECYAVMKRDTYIPKTIVEYHRKAYVMPENSIRITLDGQIRALEGHPYSFFDISPSLYPVMEPWKVILEVKYNHFLFSYIRDIIRSCNQSELSVSKYCLARRLTLDLK